MRLNNNNDNNKSYRMSNLSNYKNEQHWLDMILQLSRDRIQIFLDSKYIVYNREVGR